jgi:hypothetical protein
VPNAEAVTFAQQKKLILYAESSLDSKEAVTSSLYEVIRAVMREKYSEYGFLLLALEGRSSPAQLQGDD